MFEHELHDYLYVDIETIPEGDIDFEQLKTEEEWLVEAPKSYSKPKQQEWAKNKAENQIDELNKEFRKGSLDSLKGRIFCISMAVNDGDIFTVKYADEKHMLEEMLAWIEGTLGDKKKYTAVWVGKNLKKFDLRWIAHRTIKYGLKDLKRLLPMGKFDKRVDDIGERWDLYSYGIYTKMDDIAKFVGLEGKVGMDGSKVYDYFLEGKYDDIYTYCEGDVELTRTLHKMLL
jgi:predicted PolB exonuclease-like 3'-5' exonuclease